jgi:hypothetical protein
MRVIVKETGTFHTCLIKSNEVTLVCVGIHVDDISKLVHKQRYINLYNAYCIGSLITLTLDSVDMLCEFTAINPSVSKLNIVIE